MKESEVWKIGWLGREIREKIEGKWENKTSVNDSEEKLKADRIV